MKPIVDPPGIPRRPRKPIINTARSEDPAEYRIKPISILEASKALSPEVYKKAGEDEVIAQALQILLARLKSPGQMLDSPNSAKDYLRLHFNQQEHETFVVLFLDVKNRLIHADEMFRGSLTRTSVYPREVVKAAMKHNAAAVMLAHNHPSGESAPSESDLLLTRALVQALALVDVRVLDHFVVAGADVHSFAEHGQI